MRTAGWVVCLLAVASALCSIKARSSNDTLPSTVPSPLIVAHRGASLDAPENTLSAFALAWQQGSDAIEVDVRETLDGHIVCIHDKDTMRVAGKFLEVDSTRLDRLRELDVGSYKGAEFAGERIPLLQDALRAVPDEKFIYIDVKADQGVVPSLLAAFITSGFESWQIYVISFDASLLRAVKDAAPQYSTLLLQHCARRRQGRSSPHQVSCLICLRTREQME